MDLEKIIGFGVIFASALTCYAVGKAEYENYKKDLNKRNEEYLQRIKQRKNDRL